MIIIQIFLQIWQKRQYIHDITNFLKYDMVIQMFSLINLNIGGITGKIRLKQMIANFCNISKLLPQIKTNVLQIIVTIPSQYGLNKTQKSQIIFKISIEMEWKNVSGFNAATFGSFKFGAGAAFSVADFDFLNWLDFEYLRLVDLTSIDPRLPILKGNVRCKLSF